MNCVTPVLLDYVQCSVSIANVLVEHYVYVSILTVIVKSFLLLRKKQTKNQATWCQTARNCPLNQQVFMEGNGKCFPTIGKHLLKWFIAIQNPLNLCHQRAAPPCLLCIVECTVVYIHKYLFK